MGQRDVREAAWQARYRLEWGREGMGEAIVVVVEETRKGASAVSPTLACAVL